MSILPLDVVEKVIAIVSQDDPDLSSIKACALVCHAYLDICRKHIFASVILRTPYFTQASDNKRSLRTTIPMLHLLLVISPLLTCYIRNLTYYVGPEDLKNSAFAIRTFKKLTHLRSLEIRPSRNLNRLPWITFGPMLHHLLRLPTITQLKLIAISDFCVTDLTHCIHLEEIHLHAVRISVSQSSPPESPLRLHDVLIPSMNLSEMTYMCGVQCADGKPFINFGTVSSLSLEALTEDDYAISRKLTGICDQLVSFKIFLSSPNIFSAPVSCVPLDRCDFMFTGLSDMSALATQMLKHLDISVAICIPWVQDPYLGLTNELAKAVISNAVEEIAIHIFFITNPTVQTIKEWPWGRLDEVLGQHGWPSLRKVSLDIAVADGLQFGDPSDPGLMAVLQEISEIQFPNLSSSKFVMFKFAAHLESYTT